MHPRTLTILDLKSRMTIAGGDRETRSSQKQKQRGAKTAAAGKPFSRFGVKVGSDPRRRILLIEELTTLLHQRSKTTGDV